MSLFHIAETPKEMWLKMVHQYLLEFDPYESIRYYIYSTYNSTLFQVLYVKTTDRWKVWYSKRSYFKNYSKQAKENFEWKVVQTWTRYWKTWVRKAKSKGKKKAVPQ